MADQTLNTNSSSSSMSSSISLPGLVTMKLTEDNYILWKGQVLPIAKGFSMMGHLDGTQEAPSKTKTEKDAEGKVIEISNPEYEKWYARDQQVIAWLNSTLSPAIIAENIDLIQVSSANEVWLELEKAYTAQTKVRAMHLRNELQNCKRDGKSINEYLSKMKGFFDQLAIVQHAVADDEKVRYVLNGLGDEYKMFVTSVLAKPPVPSYAT